MSAPQTTDLADAVVKGVELARAYRLLSSGQAAEAREACGLSQADVARLLHVGRGTVSRWEARLRRPPAELALAYARLVTYAGESA